MCSSNSAQQAGNTLIVAGDAWEHIKTFVGVLKAIAIAMKVMVKDTPAEGDPVVWTFNKLAEEFAAKHSQFNSSMQQR